MEPEGAHGLPTDEWPALTDDEWGYSKVRRLTTENARGLFHGADPEELFDMLMNAGAQTLRTPEVPGSIGHVLFRHLKRMRHVYIPVHGPIHFFSPMARVGNAPRGFKALERPALEMYQPISLPVLRMYYRYMGSIWTGQVAGIVELMQDITLHPLEESDPMSDEGQETSRRKDALRESHLRDLVGVWLSCGYCPTSKDIIRVPIDRFKEDFFKPSQFVEKLFSRAEPGHEILERRCYEELAFRQAEYLSFTALVSKDKSEALLAMMLYSHHARTDDLEWDVDNEEMAWLLQHTGSENSTRIRQDLNRRALEEGLTTLEQTVKRSNRYWKFSEPRVLRELYRRTLLDEG